KDRVLMVDRVDKLGGDGGSDAAPALAEAPDTETNAAFLDAYLEVPFDVSRVFFVATANVFFDVPRLLRDRVEVITLSGYTPDEQFQIARRHLLPRALLRAGFPEGAVSFSDDAVRRVASVCTRE